MAFSDLRCIDSGYLVIATSHTILNWSLWNFAHDFPRVCRSARVLDMIFKFIFVTFSTLTLSFSYLRFYESLQTLGIFWVQPHSSYEKMHMLKMKFLYEFLLPEINFTFFFSFWVVGWGWNVVGATSTLPKFDLFSYNDSHDDEVTP